MYRRRSTARPIAVYLLLQLTGALTLISVDVAAAQTNFRASAGCPALGNLPADITAERLRCICYDVCPKEKPDAPSASNQGGASVRPDCADAETHWRSAEQIGTRAVFESHLAQFSRCPFAALAKAKLDALPAAQPAGSFSYLVGLDPARDNFLSLRDSPGGRELKRMGPDTLLSVTGRRGDWTQVRLLTGETGWASARYIACCKTAPAAGPRPTSPAGQKYHYLVGLDPNGDNWLALRSQPHMRGVRLLQMPVNTLLTVNGRDGKWLNVTLRTGETGWAYSDFIACCKAGY